MAYGCTITVNTGKFASAQSNFVWVAVTANFPTAAIDGGSTSILNGGGNLRCYTDDTKTTQLPIDVVEFTTGGTPSIVVWGLSPTLDDSGTVYIEADAVETSQPAVTDTYGRNAVYQDYLAVLALNNTGWEDLTGNGHTATLEGSGVTVTTANHPYGDKWALFTGSGRLRLASSNGLISGGAKAVSVWARRSNTTNNQGVVSSRTTSGPTNEFQITARSSITNYFMMVNDGVSQVSGGVSPTPAANVNERLTLTWDATSASTRYNANEDLTGSLTDGNLASSNDIVIGDYNNLNFSEAFEGYAGDVWIKNSYKTLDEESAEYQNQSAPGTFWATSAWEESTITVTEDPSTFTFASNDPVIDFTGTVTVTEQPSTFNFASNDPVLDFTGTVTVTEQPSTFNFTGLDPTITLLGQITITEDPSTFTFAGINPNIVLGEYESQILFISGLRPVPTFLGDIKEQVFTGGVRENYIYLGDVKSQVFTGQARPIQTFEGVVT